jgi:hypothetical protein
MYILLLYLQTQEMSLWQNSVIVVEKSCRVTPFGFALAVERNLLHLVRQKGHYQETRLPG